MYLSPATLVVVPATLIPHWRQQIARHVQRGLLRVAVLDAASDDGGGGGGRQPEAHELAWSYDGALGTMQCGRAFSCWAENLCAVS